MDAIIQPPAPPDPEEIKSPTAQSAVTDISHTRTTSISSRTPASVELRTADKREVEQLKAKIRTLEKKALENRDKVKAVDTLQSDKDRFETIIQTLQKKLKTNSEEMANLRAKYEEAEKKATQAPDQSAEFESQLELANIDKEMAEERAEMFETEFEALKARHEELELETEILREENKELVSTMSPEEKANAGWMQMERETERLRQALILLRDHSHQLEGNLKDEIKELQDNLDETEKTASQYGETAEKLSRMEENNKHLMEQLEMAETNDEVVVALQTQREQSTNVIEQLRKQIQDYEEHIQVTDELESFHVDEEKRLHYQLDESEALLSERQRHGTEQEKVIGDLEYTLTKFRDVVQGLQNDINELRRSRDISELEAHEMSSKSKAMIDLNMQLQNSASKTQLKTIDYEIGTMHAEQARSHLDIVQLFVPESYDVDRNPVLALLSFKRIRSKATLAKNILFERMRDRPHLAQDDPFMVYEVIEKMSWISIYCDRFIQFMSTCTPEQFTQCSGALYELEPVERSMTGWVEALKRDELGSDSPEYLHRMTGILQDMAEKLIVEGNEAKAGELVSESSMLERYMDSAATQLSSILNSVQRRLGPAKDEDEESMVFDKRMDQFGTKARTIKYLAGKVTQLLLDLRAGSMCLGEASWISFEDAEKAAQQIASFVRQLGKAVLADLSNIHSEEAPSYNSIAALMTTIAQTYLAEHDPRASTPDDIFSFLASQFQSLQSKVDDLQIKASDITSCTEFEVRPAPWTIRAKEIKAKKVVDQETQTELARLKSQAHEQVLKIAEKDRIIEEQKIKVEVLESRQKESKKGEAEVKTLKEQLLALQTEKFDMNAKLQETKKQHEQLTAQREAEKAELQKFKDAVVEEGGVAAATRLGENSEMAGFLRVQVDMLNSEILSLQSVVRYLKAENYGLRVPVGEVALQTARNAWLDPSTLRAPRRVDEKRDRLRREGADVLEGLIELARDVKPVKLRRKEQEGEQGHKKMQDMNKWKVARQREEVEKWNEWRDDILRRGRVEMRGKMRTGRKTEIGDGVVAAPMPVKEAVGGPVKEVRIVANSP